MGAHSSHVPGIPGLSATWPITRPSGISRPRCFNRPLLNLNGTVLDEHSSYCSSFYGSTTSVSVILRGTFVRAPQVSPIAGRTRSETFRICIYFSSCFRCLVYSEKQLQFFYLKQYFEIGFLIALIHIAFLINRLNSKKQFRLPFVKLFEFQYVFLVELNKCN